MYADVGIGDPPDDAQPLFGQHPGRMAFDRLGGTGPIWLRTNIPMARGLGFSGAVRVGSGALAVIQSGHTIADRSTEILAVAAELEGHGDNVAASLLGGVVAYVDGRALRFPIGPILATSAFVAWIPDVTTSTNRSRRALSDAVPREAAVHNIGRVTQMALAFAHDDPDLLAGSTADRLHQADRLAAVPGATEAIECGIAAGAWCGWLSGSGPTVGLLCEGKVTSDVSAALPANGHTKILTIDTVGTRLD